MSAMFIHVTDWAMGSVTAQETGLNTSDPQLRLNYKDQKLYTLCKTFI